MFLTGQDEIEEACKKLDERLDLVLSYFIVFDHCEHLDILAGFLIQPLRVFSLILRKILRRLIGSSAYQTTL